MVILLYGTDSYRRNKRKSQVIEEFKKKNPAGLLEDFNISAREKKETVLADLSRLKEFCGNVSLFGDKKMAVLENLWDTESRRGKKADDAEKAKEDSVSHSKDLRYFLKSFLNDKTAIILISGEKAPPANFTFLKSKPGIVEKIKELSEEEFKSYVKSEVRVLGVSVDDEALDFLIRYYEADLWSIMTEIERLRWVGSKIDLAALRQAGDYFESEDVFPFVQALSFPGSMSGKLMMYESMVLSREEPVKVFNILQSFSHLSPQLLERLANYDIMVKSGKMEYDEVLLDLIIN